MQVGDCWKYALEAIINWLLLYFLFHDNRLLSMLELYLLETQIHVWIHRKHTVPSEPLVD